MKKQLNDLFIHLAGKEQAIFVQDIIAYALKDSYINVKIDGVILSLKVGKSPGLGLFRPTSYKTAKYIGEVHWDDKMRFLERLPITRLVVCYKDEKTNQWYGLSQTESLIPIYDAEGIELFQQVKCRFDGYHCIHDGLDVTKDMTVAEQLRTALTAKHKTVPTGILNASRIDCAAYKIAFESLKDKDEDLIKNYVTRGGGRFKGYKEVRGNFTVTYEIAGETFTSVIDKNMKVQAAGICLNGTDKNYDLQSLISVVKEGIETDRINRVGIRQ